MRTIWLYHPIFKDLTSWNRRFRRALLYGGVGVVVAIAVWGAALDQYRHAPFHAVADSRGHFWIGIRINNVSATCLVDTGRAAVLITKDMADRIGLQRLRFNHRGSTANGVIRTASANVARFEAAGILFSWFEVDVSGGKDDMCLLGNAFLSRTRYDVANNVLTIWGGL